MAAKFDKDMLIKHRFWILIVLVILLAVAPTYLLSSSVSDKVKKKQEAYNAAKQAAEKVSNPKNEKFIEKLETRDSYVATKKNQVHEGAWLAQQSMYTYPDRLAEALKKDDIFFGEKINQIYTRKDYGEDYQNQLPEVVQIVQPRVPYRSDEDGLVQFANNDIAGVLQLRVNFSQGIPESEDIWLAQEDLWVKRELLRVIREANDLVAKFQPVSDEPTPTPAEQKPAPAADKPKEEPAAASDKLAALKKDKKIPKPTPVVVVPPKDPNHRTFRNPHWELELQIKTVKQTTTVAGNIKNIGQRRRPLGIVFKVLLEKGQDPAGILLPVEHEALAVGESCTIPEFVIDTTKVAYQGLYGVEEVLTWKTAPVKRIDALVLGYPSSRTAEKQLIQPPWPWLEKPPDAGGAPGAAPAPAAPPPPADDGGGGRKGRRRDKDDEDPTMGAGAGPGAFSFGPNDGSRTRYGLRLKRYLDYNDQVRHMPVGMVVIADAEHMSELLSAFANSRLRVQITQTHWQVSREKLAPTTDSSPSPMTPGMGPRPNMPQPAAPLARRASRRGEDDPTGPATAEERGGAYFARPGARPATGGFGQQKFSFASLAGGAGPGVGVGPRPGALNPAAESEGGMNMRMGVPGGPTPRLGGYMQRGSTTGEEEENLQLMEVAVYGIASLYQPFPPRVQKPVEPPAGTEAPKP